MSNSYEEEIRRLRDELYLTRRNIVNLMPDEIAALLRGRLSYKSRMDAYEWIEEVARNIIPFAKVLAPNEGSAFGDRAYCPLCKEGSTSLYARGFTIPEGLYRHLIGYGNVHQCMVMDAALKLVLESWDKKFDEVEETRRKEEEDLISKRKQTEILYRLSPAGESELIDNRRFYAGVIRDSNQLSMAETRLRDLGFEIILENNVKTYIRDHGDFVVYADPRANGKINFSIYKKATYKRAGSVGIRFHASGSFYLLDSWKRDIRQKYESRLAGLRNPQ